MTDLSAPLGSFAVAAALVALILRALSPSGSGNLLSQARRYARWCALIGFLAAVSTDWFDAFYLISAEGQAVPGGWPGAVGRAATPALWVGFVYVLAQFTGPRVQRSADPQPRTGLVPGKLVAALVLVLAGSLTTLWAAGDVPYRAPTAQRELSEEEMSYFIPAADGLRPAGEVLPYLALCLGLLVAATLLASLVILRRRPLPGISRHDNRVLRRVWLNRLYRTVAVVLAANGAAALHYKARWFHQQAADGDLERLRALGDGWDSVGNYAVLGVALVMLFWRPPQNFEGVTAVPRHPVRALRDHLFATQYVALGASLILLLVLWPTHSPQPQALPDARPGMHLMVLITGAALLYLVITGSSMGYVHGKAGRTGPRHWGPLPRWIYPVAGLLMAASVYFLLRPPLDYLWGLVTAPAAFILLLVAVLLLAHAAVRLASRRMQVAWAVDGHWERWYRQMIELRSLRTVTAALGALLFCGYGFDYGWVGLSLVVLCFPARLLIPHPGPERHPAAAHGRPAAAGPAAPPGAPGRP
ncbi:hypothetical protein ACF046_12695 [Glutamicibacter creatinolyticus]|uniref:hypothetical protein n=1 Tax=Glutamicibacter creatinolyticus TaxID=162496 RepID=UPI0033D5240C